MTEMLQDDKMTNRGLFIGQNEPISKYGVNSKSTLGATSRRFVLNTLNNSPRPQLPLLNLP